MTREQIEYYTRGLNFIEKDKIFIYKYIDFDGGQSMINNNTFKFSNPKDFNDPFDLYEELIDFSKYDYVVNNYTMSRSERRKIENISHEKKIEFLKQQWRRLRINYGLSCFSKTYNEILMWSHYADKHKGICIGFKIDALKLLNDGFIAFAVEYEKEFQSLPYSEENNENRIKTIMQYLSLKADCWSYEKEVRLINFDYFKNFKNQYHDFSKYAEIKEIYFGFKTSKENKNVIKKAFSGLKQKPIFYNLTPLKQKFELKRIIANA